MAVKRECTHPTCNGKCRREKKPKKPRKRIRHFSVRRERINREYSKERKQFLTDNPFCQYPGCEKSSKDVHHAKGRGKHLMDTKTWKALCRDHHRIVEENPVLAKELGLSESRLKINQ